MEEINSTSSDIETREKSSLPRVNGQRQSRRKQIEHTQESQASSEADPESEDVSDTNKRREES